MEWIKIEDSKPKCNELVLTVWTLGGGASQVVKLGRYHCGKDEWTVDGYNAYTYDASIKDKVVSCWAPIPSSKE